MEHSRGGVWGVAGNLLDNGMKGHRAALEVHRHKMDNENEIGIGLAAVETDPMSLCGEVLGQNNVTSDQGAMSNPCGRR
jgi:hypothetical protein